MEDEKGKDYTDTKEYKSKTLLQKFIFRIFQFGALSGVAILIVLSILAFFTLVLPILSFKFG